MKEFYLDAGATTPVIDTAFDKMLPYFQQNYYNPSSAYTPSFHVNKDVESVREYIAKYMGCLPKEVFFTSGASEANSWAIQGWIRKHPNGRVITTNIEHHSILAMTEEPLFTRRTDFDVIPVNEDGIIMLDAVYDAIDRALLDDVEMEDILVAIQSANSEIGTVQPIYELAEGVRAWGAHFFTDATQMFPCFDMEYGFSKNIDMMSMSGHKIGTPKGIGCLFVKKDIDLPPLIYGTQNYGKRGGTENVPYIIALGEAFRDISSKPRWTIADTRNKLLEELKKITPVKENGGYEKLSNNINITFEDDKIIGQGLVLVLGAMGVYISVGSACSAQSPEPSHVLKAIGLSDEEALRTIRISLPYDFDEKDIPEVVGRFKTAIDLVRGQK